MRPLLGASHMSLADNATLRIALPVADQYHLYGAAETLSVRPAARRLGWG